MKLDLNHLEWEIALAIGVPRRFAVKETIRLTMAALATLQDEDLRATVRDFDSKPAGVVTKKL